MRGLRLAVAGVLAAAVALPAAPAARRRARRSARHGACSSRAAGHPHVRVVQYLQGQLWRRGRAPVEPAPRARRPRHRHVQR